MCGAHCSTGALQDSCRAQGTTEHRRCGQTSSLGVLGLPQCRHTVPAAWPAGLQGGPTPHVGWLLTFFAQHYQACVNPENTFVSKKKRAFIGQEKRKLKSGRQFDCARSLPHSSNLLFLSQHDPLLHAPLCSMLLSFNHSLPSWVAPLSFFPSCSRVCSVPGWEHWFGRGTDMRQD